jgi:hypothetical protein
MGAAW